MIILKQNLTTTIACIGILSTSIVHCLAQEPGYQQRAEQYFANRVEQLAEDTANRLDSVSVANWPQQRAAWRTELLEMLGLHPLPPKGDLKAKVTGTLEHDGLTIRKLHYQSSPNLYVTANLYLPAGEAPETGWPAVVYVCGHANVRDEGRLLGNKAGYHHHGLWFARHDVACLTIDTIQLGELHGTHHGTYHLGRWDWISRGYTPVGVETWNTMRGIDYLETLDEIDSDQIGITGRSGGGAYSWYTAAVDDRIKAAVPVAGITDLQNHVVDNCVAGHCDCMYMVNLHRWDYPLVAALIAPRPLLLANSDTDSIFPLDGVIRTHRQLEQLYDRLDASENYGLLVTPGPHKDTQELQVGAFRWLLKHLTGKEPVVDRAATKELEPEQLLVFEEEIPRNERTTSVSGWFVPEAEERPAAWDWIWKMAMLESSADADNAAIVPHRETLSGETDRFRWQVLEFESAPPLAAHVVRVQKKDRSNSNTRLHVGLGSHFAVQSTQGINSALRSAAIQKAIDAAPQSAHLFLVPRESGWNTASLSGRDQTQHLRKYYLLGETAQSGQLHDLLAVLSTLTASDSDSQPISVAGYGNPGLMATLAVIALNTDARENNDVQRLLLANYPRDPRLAPALPGLLRIATPSMILEAADQVTELETASTEDAEGIKNKALDPDSAPQLANGIRIVEVTANSASVWTRLTRWPMPNLPDLPSVQFRKRAGKQSSGAILPPDGTAGLAHAVPGAEGEVRVRVKSRGEDWRTTDWRAVSSDTDYSTLFAFADLEPDTHYDVRVEARMAGGDRNSSSVSGSFSTLPAAESRRGIRLAIGTCQSFVDRDGPFGFNLYRTLQHRDVDAFILAGDVVYYDALARSVPLAHYHWQRTYSLPTLLDFHRSVPTYFLKDDHDTYVNDSWPGEKRKWTDDFTFTDGQRIFREQTGLPAPPYRAIRLGKDLQILMLEGRDDRSANRMPDGPDKTIWGEQQWQWVRETLSDSDAKFRVIVTPTPIVGPDRTNKNDNLANKGFTNEGDRVRELLANFPNTFVVCGDRHWQYHSVDPETELHEFSVGPVSDRHAGGWRQNDYREAYHRFLRVAGGYLELNLDYSDDAATLHFSHRRVDGEPVHEYTAR